MTGWLSAASPVNQDRSPHRRSAVRSAAKSQAARPTRQCRAGQDCSLDPTATDRRQRCSIYLAHVGPCRNRLEQDLIQIRVGDALHLVAHSQTMLAQERREFVSVKDDFDDCLTVGELLQDSRGPLRDGWYRMEYPPSPP